MVVVSEVGNGMVLCSPQMQREQRLEATSRRFPIPPAAKYAAYDHSDKDTKINATTTQNIAHADCSVLNSRLNNHTFARQKMFANYKTNTSSNATASKVIQRRIEKGPLMTCPNTPNQIYRHTQVILPADKTSSRKARMSSLLRLEESNQKDVSAKINNNSINGATQRGTRRIFVQKEITSVMMAAKPHNPSKPPMEDCTDAPTEICKPAKSANNKDIKAAIQTPHTPSLQNIQDLKIMEGTAGKDVAVVIPTQNSNDKVHSDKTTNRVNAEPEDRHVPIIPRNHSVSLVNQTTKPSKGIPTYSLRRNQAESVTPSSKATSSRRRQSMLNTIPHYSVQYRGVLRSARWNDLKRKPTGEKTRNDEVIPQEPSLSQEASDTGKNTTRPSLFSTLKLNSIPNMSNLVKTDFCETQCPIPTHQLEKLKRKSKQRKTMVVFLSKYTAIRTIGNEMGFAVKESENDLDEFKFNLCWSDTVLNLSRLVRLGNWQRSNHFPSMFLLCQKSHLSTTLGLMRQKLPNHFQFIPSTWSFPADRCSFYHYFSSLMQRGISRYFIAKPSVGSQGRGIIVTNDPLNDVENTTNYVVQEYIQSPLLFEKRKFDLRVYVLLIGIREPSIFMFNDGLVRICTEEYEPPTAANSKDSFKHLTNYAINKRNVNFVFNTDVSKGDVGNKRNFKFMNSWLESQGYSTSDFWDRVGSLVVKTIMSAQPKICRVYNACFPAYNEGYTCFEVLGFDVLVDSKLKVWLLEVNHTPSFATDTPLDLDIKSRLLREVLDIVDCSATDHEHDRRREREEFTYRNMSPWIKNQTYHSQWSYALDLLRQNENDGNNESKNVEASSPSVKSIFQRQDKDNLGTSTFHSVRYNSENDLELFTELVQLHRKKEDSKLVNFKRIYPSSDPDIQNVYDTIRTVAAATLTMNVTSANKYNSHRAYVASQAAKPTLSKPFNAQHPYEPQRFMLNSNEGEEASNHSPNESISTPQVITNHTTTTFMDTQTMPPKAMPYNKEAIQQEENNTLLENPQTSAPTPYQLIEKHLSAEPEHIEIENEYTNECNTNGLDNNIISTDNIPTSTGADVNALHVPPPDLPNINTTKTVNLDPILHLDDSFSSLCLEQELVPSEDVFILNKDASSIREALDLVPSQFMRPCSLADEVHISDYVTSQSSARRCTSEEQINCEKSSVHLPEQEPSVRALYELNTLQSPLNDDDPKAHTKCENLDLGD
ncbi:unnamed protein product [Phytomonas sp. Hart1]|nr:unnamed protein product [Phytomonas sp. Hart1]|eukprot:CCW67688.1 unnamed protein product [Phytomonas sp. isolate Hart1]